MEMKAMNKGKMLNTCWFKPKNISEFVVSLYFISLKLEIYSCFELLVGAKAIKRHKFGGEACFC